MLDLDNFKYVNDTLGHAMGDELIVRVANALRERLRETDIIARLGGDEFAIILPETDTAAAELLATGLLETIAPTAWCSTSGARSRSPPASASRRSSPACCAPRPS